MVLSIISILASCQGVQASMMAFERGDVCDNIPDSKVEIPIQIDNSNEPEVIENNILSDDISYELTQTPTQLNESSQSTTDSPQQWALRHIEAMPSSQISGSGSQVLVAVLDTGIDRNHEDLAEKVVAEVNFTGSTTTDDVYGHGTHIAGIIAAKDDNNTGIMGLAPESRLFNVKVADDKGRCQLSDLAAGIIWAIDNGAHVINISIEIRESTSELEEAIEYAWLNGAVIIAAAGNDGNEIPVYPAYYENCIGVTAIRESGSLAPLANHGDWVDLAAPGFNIYSTLPDGDYGYKHGTSFATAYVSGLAALLFTVVTDANNDGRLNDEVRQTIAAGCHDIGIDGTGNGSINVTDSLAQVAANLEYLP